MSVLTAPMLAFTGLSISFALFTLNSERGLHKYLRALAAVVIVAGAGLYLAILGCLALPS